MEYFILCGIIFISILIIIILVSLLIKTKRPFRQVWTETIYKIYFYFMGSKSLIEDIIFRKSNKANLITKSDKVALITGGTRGIGAEVIRMLLQCDMTVIMGCRNVEAGTKLLQVLREEGMQNGTLDIHQLDISCLNSIKIFTEKIKRKYSIINILINNAGIMYVPAYEETEEGFESVFATNYLGHFFLTHLLLPLLKNAGKVGENARIVNVSSCVYTIGKINFDDINRKKTYLSLQAYAQSKLGQVLFTNYLNRVFLKHQTNIQTHSVHPGLVNTDIFDDTSIKCLFWWMLPYIFKNPTQGAMPIVYASIEPELEGKGGSYISNCKITKQNVIATNESLQDAFFEFSEKLISSVPA